MFQPIPSVSWMKPRRCGRLRPDIAPPVHLSQKPKPVFRDVSELVGHVHREEAFDDFERQPLLSRRLSQLGPGVAWCDLDGDGWEDLVIGSGRGGCVECVFEQRAGGLSGGGHAGVQGGGGG